MKKLILTACAVTCAVSVFAQGTVVFQNRVSGSIVTHVYFNSAVTSSVIGNGSNDTPAGNQSWAGYTALSGSAYQAALIGIAGTGDPLAGSWGSLVASFRTGTGAGFISGGDASFSNIAEGAKGTIAMFAWDNSSGKYATPASALAAWKTGGVAAGFSNPITLDVFGGGINVSPNLDGLKSFNIYLVPEPSTMALAGLGAAAMLIFRRRK